MAAQKLADYARYEARETSAGQWAGRFAVALHRYLAACAEWSAMPPPSDIPGLRAQERARREVEQRLDVVWRMKERVPQELAADSGGSAGVWAEISRAVSMSRLLFARTPIPAAVPPPVVEAPHALQNPAANPCTCPGCLYRSNIVPAPPSLRITPSAPPIDTVPPLDYVRGLIRVIEEVCAGVPAVATWGAELRAALTAYEAAVSQWETQGPGYGGANIHAAVACCERLVAVEHNLPLSVHIFTTRGVDFDAAQRWIDEAGGYMRFAKRQRIQAFLQERLTFLREAAKPWGPTFT